jgi:glycosyltransferase involved in cell wall biosynthesis
MKVIHLLSSLTPGGISNFVTHLINPAVNPPQLQHLVAYTGAAGDLEPVLHKEGIKIIPCLKKGFYKKGLPYRVNKVIRYIENYFYFLKIFILLKREKPDILHSHEHGAAVIPVLLGCRMAGVNFIIHVHSPSSDYLKNKVNRAVMRWLLRADDRIVVGGKSIIEHYPYFVEHCAGNIRVIPYGIVDFMPALRAVKNEIEDQLQIPRNSFVIGYIGRLIPDKNVETLLHSFAQLIRDGHDFYLVLIGEGNSRQALEELAADLGIEKRTFFAGRVSNPGHWISVLDINVLPSSFEGFPISILESFSKEIIMVASNVTGSNSIIRNNENGFLFELDNAEELSGIIKKIYADPELKKSIEIEARNMFLENYEIKKVQKLFEAAYKEMVSE